MKYWLILMKDKERKLTCFSESPIVSRRSRILGVWIFYTPSHIAFYAVKIYFKKNQSECSVTLCVCVGGCTGRRLCRIKPLIR